MPNGLQIVEILHIDTADSRRLTDNLSGREKADAQRLLLEAFREVCSINGGKVHTWAGDGGFAFFRVNDKPGRSVHAAKQLLAMLPDLNAQTARALGYLSFLRKLRIKAHRGEVYLAVKTELDSGKSEHFDDFIKFEKKFAPHTDEVFVTTELYNELPKAVRDEFQHFQKKVTAGKLRTALYRLKKIPVPHAEDIFQRGDELESINESDWRYLRERIQAHYLNIAARNKITTGLIQLLAGRRHMKPLLSSKTLLELTLDALSSYLREAFPTRGMCISYWRAVKRGSGTRLKMISFRYPKGKKTNIDSRNVAVSQTEYKICEAFSKIEPVVTPSVNEARLAGKWKDFDNRQQMGKRSLASALQIPIFCWTATWTKDAKGVLSIDSDQPDMFLHEEVELWRDELVGFLANLALAEKLKECGG